jgi:putative peptide zinc metalloprotease protein
MERSPTFSQNWSRVNRLTPTLRPHVQITRQLFRGDPWHVVHDPVSNNFFRLNPVAYHFVGMLDGKRSIDEVWRLTLDKYGDSAPTQNEVINLLGQLNQSNLLRVDMPADAAPLLERHRRRKMKHWAGQAMSILFMRFPLFNPDRLITWVLPLVRPLLGRAGAVMWLVWMCFCAYVFLPKAGGFLRSAESVLAPANWGWMILLFIVTKALHEMGHGLMCKRFGGVVPEFGVMLLVMFPAPFVDATSSWSFADKWKRLLVAAAGMIFELAVAGGAALLWVYYSEHDPGSLGQQLAYNVVFLASVTTILFNANPLLRFDGYYMLSDILEIPNLYERAQRQMQWLVQRYAYGIEGAVPPSSDPGERMRLTVYGITSGIYRVLVLAGIILFISGQFVEIGLLLAAWSFIAWAIIPLCKFIHWLTTSPAVGEHRVRAVSVTLAFVAVVMIAIGVIPVEQHRRAQGVIESEHRADVSMLTAGIVEQVLVENGEFVRKGDVILVADNVELRARKAELEATLAMLQLEHNKGLVEDYVAMKIADVRMAAAREELDRLNQRLDDLIVRAPQSGTIVSQVSLGQIQDRYVDRGKVICRILDLEDIRVTSLISQSQNASPFSDRIQRVELRTAGRMTDVILGDVTQIFDSGRSELPHPALGPGGGGTIAVAPDDREGRRTLRPQFEIWIDLPGIDKAAYRPMPGQRVYVRFTLATKRPLLFQWIHQLHQVIRERVST